MPESLVLVRHGESESNFAKSTFEQGTPLVNEDKLMAVHTSDRRLTSLGVEQAKQAGEWLRGQWVDPATPWNMYRLFVSPYVRAMETAGYLGLKGPWQTDTRLVERNWGDLDQIPYSERVARFAAELERRKDFAFFWRPTNGETFQDVFNRLHSLKTRLRQSPARRVVMVCHGETMWVWRTILERWTPHQLKTAMLEQGADTRIHNCRIIEYSCVDSEGSLQPRISQVRFIDPSNPDLSATNRDWQPVFRPAWTDDELLEHAQSFPSFVPMSEAAE